MSILRAADTDEVTLRTVAICDLSEYVASPEVSRGGGYFVVRDMELWRIDSLIASTAGTKLTLKRGDMTAEVWLNPGKPDLAIIRIAS